MKRVLTPGLILSWLGAGGCATMSPRQQWALSGGAIGAAGSAAVGAIVGGSPTIGATVGGAAGTVTGPLWEDIRKALG